jgi:hypothetical protein
MIRSGEKEFIGLKRPVKVRDVGSFHFEFKASGAPGTEGTNVLFSEPLTNDFCEIRSYPTFEKFIATYGPDMFEREIHSCRSGTGLLAVWATGADQTGYEQLYRDLKGSIEKWQSDLQELLKLKVKRPGEFAGAFEHYESKAERIKTIHGRTISEAKHYKYLPEACACQIARTERTICKCGREGCERLFIKVNKLHVYCSDYCRYLHFREEDNCALQRDALIKRIQRRQLDKETAAKALVAVRQAKSKTALRKVEKDHGLEKRTPGPKAAKKGEARHGRTR